MPVNKLVTPVFEVLLYRARPGRLGPSQWLALASVLDESEREQAQRFRLEVDRQAYVLAHGLRRVALAQWLAVPAAALVFGRAASGQPRLLWPGNRSISFSHTRTREGALLAVSQAASVGVDMESCRGAALDRALLQDFIVLPDTADAAPSAQANKPEADLAAGLFEPLFFYWTALEAFWKGLGRGLQAANPRLHLAQSEAGHWRAWPALHETGATLADRTRARVPAAPALIFPVRAAEGCVASLALHPRLAPCMQTRTRTSAAVEQESGAAVWALHETDLEAELEQLSPLVWQASRGAGRH